MYVLVQSVCSSNRLVGFHVLLGGVVVNSILSHLKCLSDIRDLVLVYEVRDDRRLVRSTCCDFWRLVLCSRTVFNSKDRIKLIKHVKSLQNRSL